MNGLHISLQQYDEENKPKANTNLKRHGKENGEHQTNAMKHKRNGGTPKHDIKGFEKFKKEMKELGLWLEGDAFKKMTPAQQKAHNDKAKAICMQKRTA
jgi:hypothetical protein